MITILRMTTKSTTMTTPSTLTMTTTMMKKVVDLSRASILLLTGLLPIYPAQARGVRAFPGAAGRQGLRAYPVQ
jgi:hypothetical protein